MFGIRFIHRVQHPNFPLFIHAWIQFNPIQKFESHNNRLVCTMRIAMSDAMWCNIYSGIVCLKLCRIKKKYRRKCINGAMHGCVCRTAVSIVKAICFEFFNSPLVCLSVRAQTQHYLSNIFFSGSLCLCVCSTSTGNGFYATLTDSMLAHTMA